MKAYEICDVLGVSRDMPVAEAWAACTRPDRMREVIARLELDYPPEYYSGARRLDAEYWSSRRALAHIPSGEERDAARVECEKKLRVLNANLVRACVSAEVVLSALEPGGVRGGCQEERP